jgi:hypothetical protein
VFEGDHLARYPKFAHLIELFRKRHPELVSHARPTRASRIQIASAAVDPQPEKLERVPATCSTRMAEFLGPHESVPSRYHLDIRSRSGYNQEYRVQYLPAESNTVCSEEPNWRGPVWMP